MIINNPIDETIIQEEIRIPKNKTIQQSMSDTTKLHHICKTVLNKSIIEKNRYFDIVSSFDRLGIEDQKLQTRYFIIFPVLGLILFLIGVLAIKIFKYIKEYE